MPWARASSLERHLVCPAASNLPRLERGAWRPSYLGGVEAVGIDPYEAPSPFAEWGTAMHAAAAGESPADPWDTWVAPLRDVLWPPDLGEHEVTMSYSCTTGEVELLRSSIEAERTAWKMSRPDDAVVGTADWWATTPDGLPWTCDLKTGWKRPEVLTAANLFYLMCRAMVHGELHGRTSVLWWPRKADMTESEPFRLWSRPIKGDVLLAFERDLREAHETAKTDRDPFPGPHCGYCPSAGVCPRANDY